MFKNNDNIKQYKLLYKIKKNYGKTSIKFFELLIPIINSYNSKVVLDYGCGQSKLLNKLKKKLKLKIFKYDPAIKRYCKKKFKNVNFIICTDVLQHVPLNELDNVLNEIKNISKNCFFHIKCELNSTKLPNGDFANCTTFPNKWWFNKLKTIFTNVTELKLSDVTSATFLTKE